MPVELPFDINQVPQLLKEGRLKVVRANPLTPPQNPKPEIRSGAQEKAKALFGEDFLGVEAIQIMEAKFKTKGIDVMFEKPIPADFPYSEQDIEQAKLDKNKNRARMLVFRPSWMAITNGGIVEKRPINILTLRALFKKETKNILKTPIVTYDNNPFGSDAVFYKQDWYDNEDFAKEQLNSGYGLPTKEVLPGSINTTWDNQQNLLEPGERRRKAVEVVWDELLYYAATGKKVLPSHWDWTQTKASGGFLVVVGRFDSNGLNLRYWHPTRQYPDLGVCPSR